MPKKRIDIPKETLEHLYWDERLSMKAIADKLGVSITPVYHSMERHNVKRRTEVEIRKVQRGNLNITKEQLEFLYIKQKLPIVYISYQMGIGFRTIRKLLQDNRIPIRTLSEVNQISSRGRLRDKDGHGRNWKGGYTRNGSGYILKHSPDHPRANLAGYVYEHILVWEETHGRPLPKGWLVHHLNGVKHDNRPHNLEAMKRGEHMNLARPYIKRIQELEAQLKEALQLQMTIG